MDIDNKTFCLASLCFACQMQRNRREVINLDEKVGRETRTVRAVNYANTELTQDEMNFSCSSVLKPGT